jgi:DNA-binding transcriptional ArsR family regulator
MDATTRTLKIMSRHRTAKTAARARGSAGIDMLLAQAATAARMLKLLGNKYRLLILCYLIVHRELKVGDLVGVVGLSQSALSQHLALLRADGLITFRREAQTLYYRVNDPRTTQILNLLKNIYCDRL